MNIKFVMYEPTFELDVRTCAGCVKINYVSRMSLGWARLVLPALYQIRQISMTKNKRHYVTTATSSLTCATSFQATCQPRNHTRVNLTATHVSTSKQNTCRPHSDTCVNLSIIHMYAGKLAEIVQ